MSLNKKYTPVVVQSSTGAVLKYTFDTTKELEEFFLQKIGVTFQQVQKYEKGSNGLSDYMIRRLRIVFKIHKSKILFLMNKYNRRIK